MADIDNLTIKISANLGDALTKLNKLAEVLGTINTELNHLDPSRMDGIANSAKSMSQALDGAKRTAKELSNSINDVAQNMGKLASTNSVTQGMQQSMQGFANTSENASRAIKDIGKDSGGGLSNLKSNLSSLGSSISGITGYFVTFGRMAKGAFRGLIAPAKLASRAIEKFRASNNFATRTAKKFVKELTRVGKMLKLMVTRMALRKVIEEVGNGFKSLALHSADFDNAMSQIINSSKKLGYSVAAMVAPLIQALAPALVYVINLFTKLINAINQIFSIFTGKSTWNKAKDFTGKWSDEIKKTDKDAKALKKTLLGFDEINQLTDNTTTSGGGGSSEIEDMFDTVPVEQKWKDLIDKLKKMWDAADFSELGRDLGTALKKALDSIPWDKIKEGARKVGSALATLINGFMEVEGLGYSIGKTFAEGLNTIFEAIDAFVTDFHWASAGHFIADTLNGWFENIDWDLIKHTFETGFRGLGIAMAQFVQDFRWDNLSDFVSNFIDTLTGAIKAFFTTKLYDDRGFQLNYSPFYKIGYEITYQIVRAIQETDWVQFGEALGAMIQGLIDAIAGAIAGIKEKGWKPITDALQGLFEGLSHTLDFGEAAKIMLEVLVAALVLKLAKVGTIKGLTKLGSLIVKTIFGGGKTAAEAAETAKSVGDAAQAAGEAATEFGELTFSIGELTGASDGLMGSGALGAIFEGFKHNAHLNETAHALDENAQKIKEVDKAYQDGKISIGEWSKEMDNLTNTPKFTVFGETIDNWIKSSSLFRDSISLTSNEMEEYGKKQGWSAEETAKWASKIENSESKAKNTAETIKKTSDSVKNLGDTYGRSVTPLSNLNDKTGAFQKSLDNVETSTKKVTQNTPLLTKEQQNLMNQFQKTADKEPILTQAQKNIEDSLKGLQTQTTDYGDTNTTVWESFSSETANAQVSFEGTAKQISLDMNDMTKDIVDQNKTISDAFSEKNWTFSGIMEGLKKSFGDAIDAVKKLWNKFANDASDEGEIGGSKFKFKLPHFANGGFPEDGLFMANHGEMVGRFSNGRTAVANNAQIVDGISAGVYNAVSAAMSRNIGGNERYIANTIVVDGDVIARTVTKAQQKQDMRYSPSMA